MIKPKSNPLDQAASPDATERDRIVDWAELRRTRSASLQPAPGSTARKKRGRLDRAVLAMIGKGLEACFEEVRRQEVPERFKELLRQF
jgi:hypothetical protein